MKKLVLYSEPDQNGRNQFMAIIKAHTANLIIYRMGRHFKYCNRGPFGEYFYKRIKK